MIGGIASINETPQIVWTHRDDKNLCGVAMYHELSYLRTDLQRIAVSTVIEYSELIPKWYKCYHYMKHNLTRIINTYYEYVSELKVSMTYHWQYG